jgi:ABC-2 type transport system ATP-binding protein
MSVPPIQTRGLSRSFSGERAIERVDLDVAAGEVHAIVGLNGAGKTTLMRLLLGMLRPDDGVASVLGESAWEAPPGLWSKVGHLVEVPFAYPELTVTENLWAGATLRGVDDGRIDAVVEHSIERFELGKWADRRARALSLGNRQRLGLAIAVVADPEVIILDEPTNALDPAGVVFVRDLLTEAREAGRAILVSSHHLDEIARIADRISVLHEGHQIGSLDPEGFDLERRFFELVYAQVSNA